MVLWEILQLPFCGAKKKKKKRERVESSTASISLPNQMKQSPVSMSSVSHGPNAARDKPTQLVLTSVKFWVAFTGRTWLQILFLRWGEELRSLRDAELPAVGFSRTRFLKCDSWTHSLCLTTAYTADLSFLLHGETRLCHYFALYFNFFSPQGDEGPLGPPGVPGPEVSFSGVLSYYQLCWLCSEIVVEITWSFNPSGLKWEVICPSRKYCIVQLRDPGRMKDREQSFTGCWVRLWFYNLFKVSDLEKLTFIHKIKRFDWKPSL